MGVIIYAPHPPIFKKFCFNKYDPSLSLVLLLVCDPFIPYTYATTGWGIFCVRVTMLRSWCSRRAGRGCTRRASGAVPLRLPPRSGKQRATFTVLLFKKLQYCMVKILDNCQLNKIRGLLSENLKRMRGRSLLPYHGTWQGRGR